MAIEKKKIFSKASTLSEKELEDEIIEKKKKNKFPLHVFHDFSGYIEECINLGCDHNAIGSGLLTVLSTAIGSNMQWKNTNGDRGYCNLFILINGFSGGGKGRTSSIVVAKNLDFLDQYLRETTNPELRKSIVFTETPHLSTLQTKVIYNNPRGIILINEEFGDILKGMDRPGSDLQGALTKIYDCRGFKVSRAEGEKLTEFQFLTMYSETQPMFIPKLFASGRLEQGFVPRLLITNLYNEDFVHESEITKTPVESKKVLELMKRIFDRYYFTAWSDHAPQYFVLPKPYFNKLRDWVDSKLRNTQLGKMVNQSIMSRYRVNFKKIAALLQCYELNLQDLKFYDNRSEVTISDKNVDFALEIMDYYYNEFLLCSASVIDEKVRIVANLINNNVSIRQAAKILGVDHSNLAKKIKAWQVDFPHLFT